MFSEEDIRDVYRSVPPQDIVEGPLAGLPSLLLSPSGQDFVAPQHAMAQFERIILTASNDVPIVDIGRQLDIEPNAVLRFAKASPYLYLLSRNQLNIIGQPRRDLLQQRLRDLASHQLVFNTSFSQDNDVSLESIAVLLGSYDENNGNDIVIIENHFVSRAYQNALAEDIRKHLGASLKDSIPIELSSDLLQGSPPSWYIRRVVDEALQTPDFAAQFHIQDQGDSVKCIPAASVLQRRDAEVSRLQEGSVTYVKLQTFFNNFRETFASIEDARKYLESISGIEVDEDFVISTGWLPSFGGKCAGALDMLGFADFGSKIKECFPPTYHDDLRKRLERHVKTAYEQMPRTPLLPEQSELHSAGDFLLTAPRYDSEREVLLHSAQAHATQQWQTQKDEQAKDIKFQLSNIIAFIPEDQRVLQAVAENSTIKKAVEEAFWNEISGLESRNEAEFATFWVERVVSRMTNYTEGLKVIEDPKLREQLSELLSSYLLKDLVPDAISKARSQALLCSRKTKKNIQKIESSLKTSKTDISSTISVIEKFNQKQGVQELDTASLEEAKTAQVADMVRKMQKLSDGPTLFLYLVVVMLARHNPGVLYASGKFAPKLMKLLKPSLSAEAYEQLEKWKDGARAGSLSAEDKDDMRGLAGAS